MQVQKRERCDASTGPRPNKRQDIGPDPELDLSLLDLSFEPCRPYNLGLGPCVDLCTLTIADLMPFYQEDFTEKEEKNADPVPPSFHQTTFVFPWLIAFN